MKFNSVAESTLLTFSSHLIPDISHLMLPFSRQENHLSLLCQCFFFNMGVRGSWLLQVIKVEEVSGELISAYLHFFLFGLVVRRPLSYRNQSIDLLCKSMDWFLYDNGLRLRITQIYLHGLFLYFVWC